MEKLQKKAKEYIEIFPSVKKIKISKSNRKDKRFKAELEINGKKITRNFGDPNATTYMDKKDNNKRKQFKSRHSKIKLKNGKLAYKTAGTPSSLSYFLLW